MNEENIHGYDKIEFSLSVNDCEKQTIFLHIFDKSCEDGYIEKQTRNENKGKGILNTAIGKFRIEVNQNYFTVKNKIGADNKSGSYVLPSSPCDISMFESYISNLFELPFSSARVRYLEFCFDFSLTMPLATYESCFSNGSHGFKRNNLSNGNEYLYQKSNSGLAKNAIAIYQKDIGICRYESRFRGNTIKSLFKGSALTLADLSKDNIFKDLKSVCKKRLNYINLINNVDKDYMRNINSARADELKIKSNVRALLCVPNWFELLQKQYDLNNEKSRRAAAELSKKYRQYENEIIIQDIENELIAKIESLKAD